ncbi:MAG: hypothetical protein AB1567_02330 [bacterium]
MKEVNKINIKIITQNILLLGTSLILKSASSGVKRGEGGEKEGYFDKFGRELRIR